MSEQIRALETLVARYYLSDEGETLAQLSDFLAPFADVQASVYHQSSQWVHAIREGRYASSLLESFLEEYNLSSREGVLLMCLAEALLRIPDSDTRDALIQDKLSRGDWQQHLGQSDSLLVNASSWALLLSIPALPTDIGDALSIHKFFDSLKQPVRRKALETAMAILGKQFVLGETIDEALAESSKHPDFDFSFDMLGEAAITAEDADKYYQRYLQAIRAVGKQSRSGSQRVAGVSIKLSALHPKYHYLNTDAVVKSVLPKLEHLAALSKEFGIGITLDAEEANRLHLSMRLYRALVENSSGQCSHVGIAVQAYQKRAFVLLDWISALAKQFSIRIPVRLVKGAYWDAEIKSAQAQGFVSYPVFTRKFHTDISYLACAQKILSQPTIFYGQFATHNAYSIAAILQMAGSFADFEFQRLQGMGEALYQAVRDTRSGVRCRVYAPVGDHESLLPYLVRRLLENGANTSFVQQIRNDRLPLEKLLGNPIQRFHQQSFSGGVPVPPALYGVQRENSIGMNLDHPDEFAAFDAVLRKTKELQAKVTPLLALQNFPTTSYPIVNPADKDETIGRVDYLKKDGIPDLFQQAHSGWLHWKKSKVEERCACLERFAAQLQSQREFFASLCMREAGKTRMDALGEVREAVDFCRYYAVQARQTLSVPIQLPSIVGESNELHLESKGVMLCISPWNFPLAIFVGQIAAALVTGNSVIAKPASQTCWIGFEAIRLLHQAGIPRQVLQFAPAQGSEIGAALFEQPHLAGVIFTGSTEVAQFIHKTLANRPGPLVPLIAETGGQNAMIVDSTALLEQTVVDVMQSAFNSAGQRCSALRLVCVQQEIAPEFLRLLTGAMQELQMGNPVHPWVDVGPVIDLPAQEKLTCYLQERVAQGCRIFQEKLQIHADKGFFIPPTLVWIKEVCQLKKEIFGPLLHLMEYRAERVTDLLDQINQLGYGLTLGVQSRIESFVDRVGQEVCAGNIYINRNMIGATVGMQPFGGMGLSGTGPKAGGPHYLLRLCNERTITRNTAAQGGDAAFLSSIGD